MHLSRSPLAAQHGLRVGLVLTVLAFGWARCAEPTAPWTAPDPEPSAPPTAAVVSCVPPQAPPADTVRCRVVVIPQWKGLAPTTYVWHPGQVVGADTQSFVVPANDTPLVVRVAGRWAGRDSVGPLSDSVVIIPPPIAPGPSWPAVGPCIPSRAACVRLAAPSGRDVDARPRLQAVLDSLAALQTPFTLQLGAGWFSLSATPPDRWVMLQMRSGLTLEGSRVRGALATHLSPVSTAGSYRALISSDAKFSAAPLLRATIRDLIFEQQPSDNPTLVITPSDRGAHAKGIALFAGSDIRIEDNLFRMGGIHAVKISGPISQVLLRGNRVQFFRAPTTITDSLFYDQVGFYLNGRDFLVEDNQFDATFASRARTAIESHAYPAIIRRNRITGWRTGITQTTTTQPAEPGDSVVMIRDNHIEDAVQGIRFWPITGERIAGVWITNNDISLAPWQQKLSTPAGFNIVGATSPGANSDGHLERIRFIGNRIRVRPASGGEPAIATPAYTGLINLVASGSIQDLEIRDNDIVGGFTPWIRLGMPSTRGLLTDITIRHNHVTWAAATGPQHNDARTLIDLQGRLGRVRILDNTYQLGEGQRWDCAGWTGIRLRASETRDVQVLGQRLEPAAPIGCYPLRRENGTLITDWP